MTGQTLTSICVFCGAQSGNDPRYARAAIELGSAIADRGLTLVYGGGKVGLMGELATSALAKGGDVIGVIPDFLAHKEVLHPGLTKTEIVNDLFARKGKMISLADAFIALPGGIGTFDELLEVVTWRQLGRITASIGVLEVASYFTPWFDALSHSAAQGFIEPSVIDGIVRSESAGSLLDSFAQTRVTES